MKSASALRLSLFTLPLLTALSTSALAQGSLTPPAGPPAPVFKTLDQIESRTPVTSLTGDATAKYIIKTPGSYYLTGHLDGGTGKAGIRIEAVNVTLDLNGFTIDGIQGSTAGIQTTAPGGPVIVRNGMIRFFNNAFDVIGATQFSIQDVQVVSPLETALKIDGNGIVERVTITNGKGVGIQGTATSRLQIRDCRIQGLTSTGLASGINAELASVERCHIASVSGVGAYGISSSRSVTGCVVQAISSTGLGNATGIQAEHISDSIISDISQTGTATAAGIANARSATRCRVMNVNASGAAGFLTVQGVNECEASSISGTTTASGITDGTSVSKCRVSSIISISGTVTGISLIARGRASENQVSLGSGTGLVLKDYCMADGNAVALPAAAGSGISALTPVTGVRIEGNHVTGSLTGIAANDTSAVVVRNTVAGATTHYTVHAGVTVANASAPGTNPFANLRQ